MLAKLCKTNAQEQSSQALPSALLRTEESLCATRNLGRADNESRLWSYQFLIERVISNAISVNKGKGNARACPRTMKSYTLCDISNFPAYVFSEIIYIVGI